MLRFSYGMMAYHTADEAVDHIRAAEELGFHGAYLADDPSARDPWLLCAAAARETDTIRLGVSATNVYLREPTLIAQALATLDELSGGRTEAVVSFGYAGILDMYRVDWRGGRPLARLREAIGVMRRYLDEGQVTHDGEFFRYSGLSAGARPVQERLPLLIGAMGGPRSFRLAGEVGDGIHCVGSARANSEYVLEQVAKGAETVGRDWRQLDLACICLTAVAENSAAAKESARAVVAGWMPSFSPGSLERHGLRPSDVAPITEALHGGDVEAAIRLTSPEISDALSVAGTPEECAARIRTDIVEAGIEHVVLAVVDPAAVRVAGGQHHDGLPGTREQLRMVRDRVMPAFKGAEKEMVSREGLEPSTS